MILMTMPDTVAVQPPSEDETARPSTGPNSPDAVGSTAETSADAASLSTDDLFHLLQTSRRRAVLRYVQAREGPVRMRDVAEQVAAWENDTTVARLTSDERQRVYIALYQSHLPTLADAGAIAYNKPRGVIEPGPSFDRVVSYLDRDVAAPTGTTADEYPWLYLGASVVSTLLLLGTALDLGVFGLLSGIAAGALVLLLFTGVTVAKLILDGEETA